MSDRLFALRLFTRVAHTGSFSRAGRDLGLSQPSVSRVIAALEREVGAALLTRTTRALTLTEAGTDYLARIEPILDALEEADYAARGTGELRGTLRVALSSSFAVRVGIPRLPAFMRQHSALRIDLRMKDHWQDLVNEGIDVAFRLGALPDSNATARLMGRVPRILIASPAYLKEAGTPRTPADLAAHPVIAGPGGVMGGWTFEQDGRRTTVRVESQLSASINEGTIAAATAGLGIAATGSIGCIAELQSGALVRVLADWDMAPIEVHAVFPAGRAAKASARALAEHFASALDEALASQAV